MSAARDMAADIIAFNLSTVAYGECYSACTLIFLAGQSRTLEAGAKLGFHRQWVDEKAHKKTLKLTVKSWSGMMSLNI